MCRERTQTSNAEDRAPPGSFPDELRSMQTHREAEEDAERNPCPQRRLVSVCGAESIDERVAASL